MIINPNKDNGTIRLKICKYASGYLADTTSDYKIIMALGFSYRIKPEQIDDLISKASRWGFDVSTPVEE